MNRKKRTVALLLCLVLVAGTFLVGCATKRQRAKIALASCGAELVGATPVFEGVVPLVSVKREDGSVRVHDLRAPTLALLADMPAVLAGEGEWKLENAGALLALRLVNRNSRPLALDSVEAVLVFSQCEIPVRLPERVLLPASGETRQEVLVRFDVDQRVFDCADSAKTVETRMRALFGYGPDDPEPVWLELSHEFPFPREEVGRALAESRQSLLDRMLGQGGAK